MSGVKTERVKGIKTLTPQNRKYIKSLASKRNNDLNENKAKAKKKEFLKKMGTGSGKTRKSYADGLVENTTYGVEAQLIFADFFNRGSMEADQRTWYYTLDEPVTDNKARVYTISNHGSAPIQDIIQSRDSVYVRPYWVTSEEVSMSKFNLRMGDISNEEKMRQRAENSLAKKTEQDAKNLLEAGLISDIDDVDGIDIDDDVYDYPTQTDIDVTSEAEGGKITMDVLKEILEHFMLLGKRVRNIYIPSTRMTDLWDWMTLPAGYDDSSGIDADNVVAPFVQEEIIRTGTINSLFGYNVNLVPVNSLRGSGGDGEDSHIWVNTNEGAGEYRTFPTPISSVYQHEDAQRLYYSIQRATAMFQTPRQRLNYARFEIDSA